MYHKKEQNDKAKEPSELFLLQMDDRKIPPENLCYTSVSQLLSMKEDQQNLISEVRVDKETKSKPVRDTIKKYVFENEN